MFSSHAAKVLLDLVTEKVMYVNEPYASLEIMLAVPQSSYVSGENVPSLED